MPTYSQSSEQPWQRSIVILTGTLISLIVVASLYMVQVVFIPLSCAVLLTFILGPPVRFLQSRRVNRIPSVGIVMLLAASFIFGTGWLIVRQVEGLVDELPRYEANIKSKIDSLKGMIGNSGLQGLLDDPGRKVREAESSGAQDRDQQAKRPEPPQLGPALLGPSGLSALSHYLGTALVALGGLALVSALTFFMLLRREDLRGRFLRLTGRDHLTLTTKAVDEAFHRISRYLFAQLVLNSCCGAILAIALTIIGLNHALLWGIMLAVLRYVPYIGAWLVGGLLLLMCLAISSDWVLPVSAFASFVAIEVTASTIAEPVFFGKSMGVSQVALLIAAAFWAFLWGPIGMVLSGPLTVCLVVLGKYVASLKFIDVLLGDEPALAPDVSYYQRLLARDRQEAVEMTMAWVKAHSRDEVYDALLAPALSYAKRDRGRDDLDDEDEQFILDTTREILRKLDGPGKEQPEGPSATHPLGRARLVVCAGPDESDALAVEMFRQLIDPTRWEIDIQPPEMLSSEIVAHISQSPPAVVCIGALPPGGLAHARYMCKRLRAAGLDLKILVGLWEMRGDIPKARTDLQQVGADDMETSLLGTRDWLNGRFAALAAPSKEPVHEVALAPAAS